MTTKCSSLLRQARKAKHRRSRRNWFERRLAACVNIVPRIQSVYRWEGKIETAEEFLLIIKTTKARSAEVNTAIRELHSYDLPECVVISMEDGSAEYLKWIEESVS